MRGPVQVLVQHARLRLAERRCGPGAGNAATGVPQARLSSITRPKVSVREGNTNTSAPA